MKDPMKIILEVSMPDRGSFIKFDSEKQSEIRLLIDGSQYKEVCKLANLPYGETFKVVIEK